MAAAFTLHRKRRRELSEKRTTKEQRCVQVEKEAGEGHDEEGQQTAKKGGSRGAMRSGETDTNPPSAVVLMHVNRTQFATKARKLRPSTTFQSEATGTQTQKTGRTVLQDGGAGPAETCLEKGTHTRQRETGGDDESADSIPLKKALRAEVSCVLASEPSGGNRREGEHCSSPCKAGAVSTSSKETGGKRSTASEEESVVGGVTGGTRERELTSGEASVTYEERQGYRSAAGGEGQPHSRSCPLVACPRCHLLMSKSVMNRGIVQGKQEERKGDREQSEGKDGGGEAAGPPCSDLTVEMVDGTCEFNQCGYPLDPQNSPSPALLPLPSPCWRWKIVAISVYLGGFARRLEEEWSLLSPSRRVQNSYSSRLSDGPTLSSPFCRLSSPSPSPVYPASLCGSPVSSVSAAAAAYFSISGTPQHRSCVQLADSPHGLQTSDKVGSLLLSLVRATLDLFGVPVSSRLSCSCVAPPNERVVGKGHGRSVNWTQMYSERLKGRDDGNDDASFPCSRATRRDCVHQQGSQQMSMVLHSSPAFQPSPFGTPLTTLLDESLPQSPGAEGYREVSDEAECAAQHRASGSSLSCVQADPGDCFSRRYDVGSCLTGSQPEGQDSHKETGVRSWSPSAGGASPHGMPKEKKLQSLCCQPLFVPCGRVRPFDFLSRARALNPLPQAEDSSALASLHVEKKAPEKRGTKSADSRRDSGCSQDGAVTAGDTSTTPVKSHLPRERVHSLIYGIRVDPGGRGADRTDSRQYCKITQGNAGKEPNCWPCHCKQREEEEHEQSCAASKSADGAVHKRGRETREVLWAEAPLWWVVRALVRVTQAFLEKLLISRRGAQTRAKGAASPEQHTGSTSTKEATGPDEAKEVRVPNQSKRLKTQRHIQLEPGSEDATVPGVWEGGTYRQPTTNEGALVPEGQRECLQHIKSTSRGETVQAERRQAKARRADPPSEGNGSDREVSADTEPGGTLAIFVRQACTGLLYAVLALLGELHLTVQAVDTRQNLLVAHTPGREATDGFFFGSAQAPAVSTISQEHEKPGIRKGKANVAARGSDQESSDQSSTQLRKSNRIVRGSFRQANSDQPPTCDESLGREQVVKAEVAGNLRKEVWPEEIGLVAGEGGSAVRMNGGNGEYKEAYSPCSGARDNPSASDRRSCLCKKARCAHLWLSLFLSHMPGVVTPGERHEVECRTQPLEYGVKTAAVTREPVQVPSPEVPAGEHYQAEAPQYCCQRLHNSKAVSKPSSRRCLLCRVCGLSACKSEHHSRERQPLAEQVGRSSFSACFPLSRDWAPGPENDPETVRATPLAQEFVNGAMSTSALSWILSLCVGKLLEIEPTSVSHA